MWDWDGRLIYSTELLTFAHTEGASSDPSIPLATALHSPLDPAVAGCIESGCIAEMSRLRVWVLKGNLCGPEQDIPKIITTNLVTKSLV